MRQWQVIDDRVRDLGEVPYLGVPIENNKSVLPDDYDGWFPFMRFCYSLGDLGIISGLFEALKQKYPKLKIAVPSNEYITKMFGSKLNVWSYDQKSSSVSNVDMVWGNNPYIDYRFNIGEFDVIFTDHDRSYTSLIHDGEMVRSCDEPLVEQILRRFGFSEEDITNIDSSPKLYFTTDESIKNDKLVKSLIGDNEYGCLMFASRLNWAKGRWSNDSILFEAAEKFKGMPVFYFSEFNIKGTEWEYYFPNSYNFADYDATIRDQIYIKRKAKFNISYQAGITDASNGDGSEMHILCPYPTIRENCVRRAHYYYINGEQKKF
tara:strand:+ start:3798 stop:4757 length:960 start_codon:yes stop_codon:yes gene_type:complete